MDNHLVALKEAIKKAEQEYYSAVEAYMSEILRETGFDDKDVYVRHPDKDFGRKGALRIRRNPVDGKPEIVFYEYTSFGELSSDAPYGCRVKLHTCESRTKEGVIDMLKYCYAPTRRAEEVTFNA